MAFRSWKDTSLDDRIAIANRFLDEMVKARDELSHDLSKQMGRPVPGCGVEVDGTVKRGKHMIHLARTSLADTDNKVSPCLYLIWETPTYLS